MTNSYSILVIDSNEDNRDIYLDLLRNEPTIKEIRIAATGREGIATYRTSPTDCILLDSDLLVDDDLAIFAELKASDAHVAPVIVLTGRESETIPVAALEKGTSDHIVRDLIALVGCGRLIGNAVEKAALKRKLDDRHEEQQLFLRSLIHDTRAPLHHIATFAEILEEDIRAGSYDEVMEHSNIISISSKRVQNLIDSLATYAFPDEDVAFESVCMDDVVKAALDNLTEIIAKREALVSHEPLPIVFGHAPQLIQLVQHLIDNSIRFCDQDIPRVTVSVREDNTGALLFEVGDNGIGIRESHLTYVFEPFKRLWSQDTYEGTGLGLAICKRIVEGHGGKIWCESEEGKGSRFLFMLDNVPT